MGTVELQSHVNQLTEALTASDTYTAHHSSNVSHYATTVAKSLHWNVDAIENLAIGALLHDVGKITIPSTILNKKGKLSKEEYEQIKKHPEIGLSMIKNIHGLTSSIKDIVLYHHERYDGLGYPLGLSGESIPLAARIVAVCDAFDAMVTTRPYKDAWTLDHAFEQLRMNAGTQFDPAIVEAFIQCMQ